MKKILVPFLIMVFLFAIADDASAQRRGKKKREKKEDTEQEEGRRDRDSTRDRDDEFDGETFADKLNIEIKIGNLQFFNSVFQIAMKSNAGYKFNKTFSAGLGAKFDYAYVNNIGIPDRSFFSYGALAYGRAKITQQLYFQAEYSAFNNAFAIPRRTFFYPSAGLGYMQVGYDWSSGVEILVPLNGEARDAFGLVEYYLSFSKNF